MNNISWKKTSLPQTLLAAILTFTALSLGCATSPANDNAPSNIYGVENALISFNYGFLSSQMPALEVYFTNYDGPYQYANVYQSEFDDQGRLIGSDDTYFYRNSQGQWESDDINRTDLSWEGDKLVGIRWDEGYAEAEWAENRLVQVIGYLQGDGTEMDRIEFTYADGRLSSSRFLSTEGIEPFLINEETYFYEEERVIEIFTQMPEPDTIPSSVKITYDELGRIIQAESSETIQLFFYEDAPAPEAWPGWLEANNPYVQ
jgi:hypothetical protein